MIRFVGLGLLICGLAGASATIRIEAKPWSGATAAEPQATEVSVGADNIGGVVTSSKGPEAGVWVIAETKDLRTKFRKIVVTDDRGRYLLPELPKANYKVWVRGYGLVDSNPVQATPGKTLALTATVAPDAKAAAQYYPPNYWYSLFQVPPKSAFPMTIPAPHDGGGKEVVMHTQAEWIWEMKRGCEVCHQIGNKATRQIPPKLGAFDSTEEAWTRLLQSGQIGTTNTGNKLGHGQGVSAYSKWIDQITAGELPPTPPRPEGVERNVVLTLWDYSNAVGFPHDIMTTDKRNPTANAYGPVYAPDWSLGTVDVVDPIKNTSALVQVPLRNESDRKLLATFTEQKVVYPSPFWGMKVVRTDPVNAGPMMFDDKGRMWFNVQTRLDVPAYCLSGSNNPFAKAYPMQQVTPQRLRNQAAGAVYYDPKTGKFGIVDLCFGASHVAFASDKNDRDETLYFAARGVQGVGWVKTRVWDETQDAEKSQGWCAAVIDYNGDGKTGPYTKPEEPADPKLDRLVGGPTGYIIATNPFDGSVWYQTLDVPGKLVRMAIGSNPPESCRTEVYEPPFDPADANKQSTFSPEGIDVDSNGVVWTALSGSGQLASFDRRKCKVLKGPAATGQHCPEGWTTYQVPGPKFKGADVVSDFFYNMWVDRFDTSGFGKDAVVTCGTGSDSLIVYQPDTKKWTTMRVPYPMGFFCRSADGRIDDAKAGWKGRGLWAGDETRTPWHDEGGAGESPVTVHFQLRPDPLAR
jgi:hypothetical protein